MGVSPSWPAIGSAEPGINVLRIELAQGGFQGCLDDPRRDRAPMPHSKSP
jgi:hypothetical protein